MILSYVQFISHRIHISSSVLYFTSLISCSIRCIFVGDFNFPDINWSSLIGSSLSSNTFCEFIFDCSLTQHVMQPTHIKGNILDLVLTTPSVNIEHISVSSDHLLIFPIISLFLLIYLVVLLLLQTLSLCMYLIFLRLTLLISVPFYWISISASVSRVTTLSSFGLPLDHLFLKLYHYMSQRSI